MNDIPKTKGISLNISDGEVSIGIPEEIESKDTGYKCLILDHVCDYCIKELSSDDILPDVTICTAGTNPVSIFELQRCPKGKWYKGRPPAPEQDLSMIEDETE